MTPITLPVAFMAGVTLYAGAFHLFLYARTSDHHRHDLYFGVTALLIAVYDGCCIGLYNASTQADGEFWQRLQLVVVANASLSFVYFFDAYARVRGPGAARRIAWLFPAIGAVALFERRGWLLTGVTSVKRVDLPLFGTVTSRESQVGPLYYMLAASVAYIIAYALSSAARARRAGDPKRFWVLLLASALFLSGAINDLLITSELIQSVYVFEYTWTSVVVLAAYSLSNDVVAASMAKQSLAEGQIRLAHAERLESVGKLAGGVAHDLNNMLTPVLGYAQLAQPLLSEGSRERQYMDHLLSAAERAAALTRQLLAFGRRQVLEVRPLHLGQSLHKLEPLLRRLLPENIRLRISVQEGLSRVEADAAQLEQVWMNLASNARDAMPQGGTLDFSVVSEPDGERGVLVCVRDTGVGMPRNVKERVFDPFFTTKPRGQGTGLGLSIVHGIVEQHGGRIDVESAPDRGTTFRLRFPAAADRALDATPRALASARSGSSGTEWVLVVDDDEAVRRLTVEVLTQEGYAVRSAGSERELRALLAESDARCELLLSDVIMPDMDGNQVHAIVADRFAGVACVFMTGHADEVLAPRGVLREHVELLRKPFTPADLAAKVRSVLDEKRLPAAQRLARAMGQVEPSTT